MKNIFIGLIAVWGLFLVSCETREPMAEVIERGLEVSKRQAVFLAKEVENQKGRLPRTYEGGELKTSDYRAWISGFFPGVLWYLYENTPTDELKRYAELYTERVESAKDMTTTHDLGFMLYCSFGNGYRLAKNPYYLEVMTVGAESLTTRYDERVKAIKSWNSNEKWQFPVIIDNMMNLEFLFFLAKTTGEKRLMNMADSHAQTTLRHHFRDDYSCYHVVSYDTLSGQPHFKGTHQGYADNSAWARGQAWALYGYTMMYRETGKTEYLEQARKVASYIKNHPNLPDDKIPYWDFDAPDIPAAPRDASAAAVTASALIELSTMVPDGQKYLDYAEKILKSLSSDAYLAKVGDNQGFILLHSVGSLPNGSEIDTPLNYADYYYLEALKRFMELKKLRVENGELRVIQ